MYCVFRLVPVAKTTGAQYKSLTKLFFNLNPYLKNALSIECPFHCYGHTGRIEQTILIYSYCIDGPPAVSSMHQVLI